MESNNYWKKRNRISRRRLLAISATGAAGLAAAAFVGCGDDADQTEDSGPLSTGGASPVTGQPKRGGTLRVAHTAPITSLDPYVGAAGLSLTTVNAEYSRLVALASGKDIPAFTSKVVPDIAKSWETPDPLTYTFKLNENAKFRPPLARAVTADDVLFSFQRYTGKTPGSVPAAEAAKFSTVQSVDKIDNHTVRFTLKEPVGTFLSSLVPGHSILIVPQEIGLAYDPTKAMNGSGPWILESYDPSIARFRRNQEWHLGTDKPYIDKIEWYVIPDANTQLSQFMGGNLDEVTVPATDVKRVMDAVKGALFEVKPGGSTPLSVMAFSATDIAAGAPIKDPRVRQAISMAVDRDAMGEAAYGLKELEGLGIKVDRGWNNFVPVAFKDFWMDPQKMDPKYSRFFKYDPEGAKKLLAEAGFANGFDIKLNYTTQFGPDYRTTAELFQQYLGRVGVRATLTTVDYAAEYPKVRRGEFSGMAFILVGGASAPEDYLAQMYQKASGRNSGKIDDPNLETQLKQILATQSEETRKQKIIELQNGYLSEKMYYIPTQVGAGPSITAFQPYMRNVLDYRSTYPGGVTRASDNYPYHWIDK